jgi:hypothetical protein
MRAGQLLLLPLLLLLLLGCIFEPNVSVRYDRSSPAQKFLLAAEMTSCIYAQQQKAAAVTAAWAPELAAAAAAAAAEQQHRKQTSMQDKC